MWFWLGIGTVTVILGVILLVCLARRTPGWYRPLLAMAGLLTLACFMSGYINELRIWYGMIPIGIVAFEHIVTEDKET